MTGGGSPHPRCQPSQDHASATGVVPIIDGTIRIYNVGPNASPAVRQPEQIRVRCPGCRHQGTLDVLVPDQYVGGGQGLGLVWGVRRCPNEACGALIFVVWSGETRTWEVIPAETIDFDASDLPEPVVAALEEAVKCHASQCYVAAAIMVRKTLEVVCDDRGATGSNLFERIQSLGTVVVLPQAMLDALQDLRLLGNDAAHIESQVYNDVGQPEVEAAIAVTKEILKATYQYESIMGQLRALKKSP